MVHSPNSVRLRLLVLPVMVLSFLVLRPMPADAQTFEWYRQFGTDVWEVEGYAVAASVSGVYVGGKTRGVFPGQTSPAANDPEAFVARYDTLGNQIWVRQFGATTANGFGDQATGVAADASGVYVVGWTNGTLPQQTSSGSTDAFIRKYDVNGTEQWTRQFGTTAEDQALAVAVNATGVYVVGVVECCAAALPGQTNVGGSDAFLRKYDVNGNELFTRQFGTGDGEKASGVAVDGTGIYIAGWTYGALVPVTKTSLGDPDGFVRKYDLSGNVAWTRQFTSTTDASNGGADLAYAVAVNASGVYVAGETTGAFPGQSKVGGLYDSFVTKFDLAGTPQWTRQFGTTDDDHAFGVAVSSAGVHVVGSTHGALPGQTFLGLSDSYVRVYDVNGTETGTLQFGNAANDEAFGAAADGTGVYVAGYRNDNPFNDAYVAKIPPPLTISYLPHLALGGGWQTTLTYLNYSASPVTCTTTFLNDAGAPLAIPFGGPADSVRTDVLPPGGSIHSESTADLNAGVQGGWARVACTAPIKPSILFRFYDQGVPTGEASVNASEVPAKKFVTFAERRTGIAYANPSTQAAQVTFTAMNAAGQFVASENLVLQPGAHGSANLDYLFGTPPPFVGSTQIVSSVPIVTLSLNFEAFPVFSSLPPGDFDDTVAPSAQTYYLPHLALGGGWQTTLTYLNYSASQVSCTTTFLNDAGAPLPVPFGGAAASSRGDTLAPGGSIHIESTADLNAPAQAGWARVQCTAAIKPSILFRFYNQGVPTGEASVSASRTPASRFVTFAERRTGVAYANPSAQTATVTVTAFNSAGQVIGSANFGLAPGAHGAANLESLLGITNFVGSAQIVSTVPIVTLSLNAEAFPVFSSLPPGDFE